MLSDDANFFIAVTNLSGYESVVRAYGEIDCRNAARLQEAILDALLSSPTMLTVDLTKVSDIDGTCIDVLLSATERAQRAGTALVLEASQPIIAQLFEEHSFGATLDLTPYTGRQTDSVAAPSPIAGGGAG